MSRRYLRWRRGHIAIAVFLATGAAAAQPGATSGTAEDAALRPYLAANGLLSRGMNELAAAEYRDFLAKNPGHEHAPTARYGLAVALFRGKDLAGAEAELAGLQSLAGFSFAPEVAVMLAQCRLGRGDAAAAAEGLRGISQKHAEHELADDAAALLVESWYRAGRFEEASDAAEAFAERFAASPLRDRAELFAGLALVSRGDDAAAADWFRGIVERSPRGELAGRAMLLLGRASARTGDLRQAESALRRLLKDGAGELEAEAMLSLAEVLQDAGNARESAGVLDSILERFPQNPVAEGAQLRRARIWFDDGEYGRALAMLDRLGEDGAGAADEVAYWSAKCLLRSGKEVEAATRLTAAVERHGGSPLLPAMRYDLAVAQVRAGEQERAAETLAGFLAEHADHPLRADAMQLAAGIALHLGDHERALALSGELLRAGKLADGGAGAAMIAAEAQLLAGREDEAAAAYREFLNRHGEHAEAPAAAFRLGTLLYRSDQVDDAAELLSRVADGARTREMFRPALLLLGDLALRRGEWEEAAELLGSYLSFAEVTSRDDAMLKLGIAQQRLGELSAAAATLDRLVREYPRSPHAAQARLELAQILRETGDLDGAAASLEKVMGDVAAAELHPYAALRLGAIAEQRGDLGAADGFYADAEASAGAEELKLEAAYHRGRVLAGLADHRGAADRFARVAAAAPHRRAPDAAARRAIALARAGETAAAIDAFALLEGVDTAKLDPALLDAAAYERAWCLRELGRGEEAAEVYASLLGREPAWPLAAYAAVDLAEIKLEAGEHEAAAVLLKRVHDAAAADGASVPAELRVRAAYRLGAEAMKTERFEEAAGLLSGVCDDAEASNAMAVSAGLLAADAMAKLGRHEQAIRRLVQVLEDREPDDDSRGAALLRLGDAHGAVQAWDEAAGVFTTHLERFPGSELWFQARFGLGWAHENQSRYEEAIKEYREVTDRHSGATAARAQFQIGECLYAMERYEEAARELLKVDILYAYPQWSAAALYEAGRCFEAMKDAGAARQHYELVRERYPESRWARLAAQRLEMTRAEPVPGR